MKQLLQIHELAIFCRRKVVYKMDHKILVSIMYLKDGAAVKSIQDHTLAGDYYELAKLYNDNGVDKIILLDLSDTDEEHEKNLHVIREISRTIDIPICGGGNVERLEDVKKLFFAGCKQVLLNGSKASSFEIAEDASSRFGKDKINISINTVDFLFKHKEHLNQYFHEILVLNPEILDAIDLITDVPYVVMKEHCSFDEMVEIFKRPNVRGISGDVIHEIQNELMRVKTKLSAEGIFMDNFEPKLKWTDLKLNSDGMVPVIVQDYRTDEVLMLAYMNEEAFQTTISLGKMTYWSRSRNELWTKGLTSGHVQYVKSLTADCDYDTLLAKVSQVGVACHTGNRSCFFNEIVRKEYIDRNPLHIFEETYATILERREHPSERSYINYILEKGLDQVLKKCGEEATELILAAKNEDTEALQHEISDYLYHLMILMVEKGVTWEEITRELLQR